MKKTLLLIAFSIFAFTAAAQYQLLNPGFESWEGTSTTAKPSYWSSFPQSDGTWAWAARTAQHYHRNGGRPGTGGSSYLTIYSRSVLGVVANGNMTTGQVHAGSTTAASPQNYNYTHRCQYAHPFSGTPDSMYVWASFYAADTVAEASIRAVLHGDNDFKDPNDCSTDNLYKGYAVARFGRTTSSNSTPNWIQFRVPFLYDGTSTVNYILMSMTTNAIQGSGHTNDSLSVDDIEFIYSAWLDTIAINGTPISNFQRDSFDYALTMATANDLHQSALTFATQAADATVAIDTLWVNDYEMRYTLHVTAEDTITTRTYTVTLTAPEPVCNPVTDIAATVELNTAILTWTPGEGNLAWEVEYGHAGFELGTGILMTTNSSALALNALDYDQTYEAYLRAVCSDSLYTEWSEAISFTTDEPLVVDCLAPDSLIATPSLGQVYLSWTPNAEVMHQILILDNTDTIFTDTTSTNNYEVGSLFYDHTYIAKVRPICDTYNVGPWVATTFTTEYCDINTAEQQQLRIYPNPAHDVLNIDTEIDFDQICIYDIQGRKALESSTCNINLQSLPAGLYTVALMRHGQAITLQRIVVR